MIKKIIVLVFISFYVSSSYGQVIPFELYVYNPCEDSTKRVDYFVLMKDSIAYFPENNNGIVYLPDTGKYLLFVSLYVAYVGGFDIHLTSFDAVIDTVIDPPIEVRIVGGIHPTFSGYYCCDGWCNGNQVSYYANGNKHIEGDFVEGQPVRRLYEYYPTGSLKEERHYRKGRLVRTINYTRDGSVEEKMKYRKRRSSPY